MKGIIALLVPLCLLALGSAHGGIREENITSPGAPAALGIKSAPLLLQNNRVFTWVSVNGSDERLFFVDNGWSQTTIDPDVVKGAAFAHTQDVTFKALDRSDNTAYEGSIEMLQVGNLQVRYPFVRISDLTTRMSREFKKRIHGVLAWETMRHFLTTFDFGEKKVYFSEFSPTVLASIYAGDDVSALEFGPHNWSQASVQIFSVKLAINGVEVDACVDLGYPGSILTTLKPGQLGLTSYVQCGTFPVAIAGREGMGVKTEVGEVTIGKSMKKNVPLVLFDAADAPEFTIIGVEFLKNYKVTFDYRDRKLYLAETI